MLSYTKNYGELINQQAAPDVNIDKIYYCWCQTLHQCQWCTIPAWGPKSIV